MKKSLFLLLSVLTIVSCRPKLDLDYIFDIPFPIKECDSFFQYDTVTFASNNGDTVVCWIKEIENSFRPYVHHNWEFFDEDEDYDDIDGDELEIDDDEIGQDELYFHEVYYMNGGERLFAYRMMVNDRMDFGIDVWKYKVKSYSWGIFDRYSRPTNDIFSRLYQDTIVLLGDVTDMQNLIFYGYIDSINYAVIVSGKGLVKYVQDNGAEVWELVE